MPTRGLVYLLLATLGWSGSARAQPSPSPAAPSVAPGGILGGCIRTTQSFPADAGASTIPDGGTLQVTFDTTSADPWLLDVDLMTHITHASPDDLDITLTSPEGMVVVISTDNAQLATLTRWDDQAGTTNPPGPITDSGSPTSPVVPEGAMGAFTELNTRPTWTLTITDDTTNATGGTVDLAQTQLILTTRPRGASLNTIGDQPSTVFSNPVPVSIVDNQTVTSQITVSGVAPAVIETTVITWIRHPFPATLNVTLTSPQGTVVTISTGSGDGAQDTFNGTYWQDKPDSGSTPTPVTDGSFAAFVTETPLVPEEAMAAFDGEDPNGVWTLTITDTAAVLEGTLDNWALIFREISCPTAFEVTKTAASAVLAGTSLVYTITVNNLGPHEVRNATLTDPLPPNTTFQSLAPPAGWACTTPAVGANGTVSCTKPDVALSEGGVFTLTVLVDAATPAGTILSNAVSYSADNPGGFTAPAANTTVINLPTVAIAVPTTGAATTATSPFLDVSGTSTPPPSLRAIAGPDPGQAATITSVTWANDRGGSGTATGTTAWSIRAVPLQAGTNVVTVTATDSNGASSTDTLTVTVSEFLYYLAEGATGPLFDFDLLLGNPNGVPAPVTISFLREVGAPVVVTETLAANSRRTLRVNDVPGLATAAISTVVASTAALPLSVERSMLWDASVPAPRPADGGTIAAGATYYGGHTAKAVDSPRTTWFFAEGSQGFFATFLLLANANATPTDATVTYLVEGGSPVV